MQRMIGVLAMGLVLVACKGEQSSGDTAGSAAPSGSSAPLSASSERAQAKAEPSGTPKFLHKKDPIDDEAGRKVESKFVKMQGSGDDAEPVFALTNKTGKKMKSAQTWVFYYDKDGKYLDRYPHAIIESLEDGKTVERALGQKKGKMKKETATYELEVSRVTFEDDTVWYNDDLVPNFPSRPKGGVPADELSAHTGEKVTVDVYALDAPKVRLKNESDKEVKDCGVQLFYWDGKEKRYLTREVGMLSDMGLKPGESRDFTLEINDFKVPPEAKIVAGTVPNVTFADGTKFTNRKLESFDRQPPQG